MSIKHVRKLTFSFGLQLSLRCTLWTLHEYLDLFSGYTMALSWVITTMCFIGIVHSGTYESFMLTEHNRYRKMEVAANMQKMVSYVLCP